MKKTYMQMVNDHLAKTQDSFERGASIREVEIELCRQKDLARIERDRKARQRAFISGAKSLLSDDFDFPIPPVSIDLFDYEPPTQLESALATLKRLSISGDSA